MQKIKLYKTNTCFWCRKLKEELDEKNIAYEEITDIDIMKGKGIMQVPVLETSNGIFSGYQESHQWILNNVEKREVYNG